jgi:hypothetical protein
MMRKKRGTERVQIATDRLRKLAMREHISNLEIFGVIVSLVRRVARRSLRFLLSLLS